MDKKLIIFLFCCCFSFFSAFAQKGREKQVADSLKKVQEKAKEQPPVKPDTAEKVTQLKEVKIVGKPNPLRFMQDTIEYNVGAFDVREGDRVSDLLKQLPGMEVDENLKVSNMGKELIKLRVNGKDFFSNSIEEFIAKLPAGILDKIQVIDDYGEEANFTGVKKGEPKKILNLVTKPGMDNGKFGNAMLQGGTNDKVAFSSFLNFWKGQKQQNGALSYRTEDNGSGHTRALQGGGTTRNSIGKFFEYGLTFSLNGNKSDSGGEQVVTTVYPTTVLRNESGNHQHSRNNNVSLRSDFTYNNKKLLMNGNLAFNTGGNNIENASFSKQSGLFRQDVRNESQGSSTNPGLNGQLMATAKLKNNRNYWNAYASFNLSRNKSDREIRTQTSYYDVLGLVIEKDSLLNRLLEQERKGNRLDVGFSGGVGVGKKDSLIRRSLSFRYGFSYSADDSRNITRFIDPQTASIRLIDSLSSKYFNTVLNQQAGLSYNYSKEKLRYDFGIVLRPSRLTMNNYYTGQKIENDQLNFSPAFNANWMPATGKNLSMSYAGTNNAPAIQQMQPVKDVQNLQNIIVGNPNLKSYFTHRFNVNYNLLKVKSGISVMGGLSFTTTQNEVIASRIYLPDTLNSIRQETHYLNVNGNYNWNANYNINIPLAKKKYALNYSGSLGAARKLFYINSNRMLNDVSTLRQTLRTNINLKKLRMSGSLSYALNDNSNANNNDMAFDALGLGYGGFSGERNPLKTTTYGADFNGTFTVPKYTLTANINHSYTHNAGKSASASIGNSQNTNMSLSAKWNLMKKNNIQVSAQKMIRSGGALQPITPLFINAALGRNFMKNKALGFNIRVSDLLNQGKNMANGSFFGNSIVENLIRRPARTFSFDLTYNLSNFGGVSFTTVSDSMVVIGN